MSVHLQFISLVPVFSVFDAVDGTDDNILNCTEVIRARTIPSTGMNCSFIHHPRVGFTRKYALNLAIVANWAISCLFQCDAHCQCKLSNIRCICSRLFVCGWLQIALGRRRIFITIKPTANVVNEMNNWSLQSPLKHRAAFAHCTYDSIIRV